MLQYDAESENEHCNESIASTVVYGTDYGMTMRHLCLNIISQEYTMSCNKKLDNESYSTHTVPSRRP